MTGRTLRLTELIIPLLLLYLLGACTAASIECPNGDAYRISTEASRGNCDANYAEGGCLSTTGSGTCEVVE